LLRIDEGGREKKGERKGEGKLRGAGRRERICWRGLGECRPETREERGRRERRGRRRVEGGKRVDGEREERKPVQ
jgi:hypothetical protein